MIMQKAEEVELAIEEAGNKNDVIEIMRGLLKSMSLLDQYVGINTELSSTGIQSDGSYVHCMTSKAEDLKAAYEELENKVKNEIFKGNFKRGCHGMYGSTMKNRRHVTCGHFEKRNSLFGPCPPK